MGGHIVDEVGDPVDWDELCDLLEAEEDAVASFMLVDGDFLAIQVDAVHGVRVDAAGMVRCGKGGPPGFVEAWDGQDHTEFPARSFLPAERALPVLEELDRTGQLVETPDLEWVDGLVLLDGAID